MIKLSGVKAVVTDIEGTTSSISFVHEVLFPYARERLGEYVRSHESELTEILAGVREIESDDSLSTEDCISVLERWIDEDRKATPLKALQGLIWEDGYTSGAFHGHVYDDAVAGLRAWKQAGLDLYVYSSGSIAAQKLIFGYSVAGDLTPLFSGYFDTTTGGKKEALSYAKIAEAIGVPAGEIVFLSDVVAELEAAKASGLQTVLLDRDHAHSAETWPAKTDSFSSIQFA
ncbi:acireductone synthase [Ponticaulis sp.]|uniref:acireductone synthase n=1 Tax=Ponticaulis sp. TaxID=2020902 RepID=UPI000B674007|nr:acireductone synthase [Ponticaulis sp.]MAI91840.1 acireductone synthase [Ponticaulis sp.]OUX96525.1 MAG: acireductone synthase [Hyphomonadaceae bacterium TMED5]|tara:strand:- start:2546 stop:3235 length:690 start_codon:yes stop_codon:yes gene_type:complete